jgi:hypothetical protein
MIKAYYSDERGWERAFEIELLLDALERPCKMLIDYLLANRNA